MLWDKLENYINRKELSKKAIGEVCEIMASEEYSTDKDIDGLVKVLLKFKPVVLYTFMTNKPQVLSKDLAEKIVARIDVHNSQKAGHIYCMVIALDKINFTFEANSLLIKFVRSNVSTKMSNQIFDGFRQALKYGYDTFLFSKFEGWTQRDINQYGLLLTKSAEYINDPQFTAAVKACGDKNSAQTENSAKDNNKTIHEEKKGAGENGNADTVAQDKKNIADDISIKEILNLLQQKFVESQNAIKTKDCELNNLKSSITNLKANCMDMENKYKKAVILYESEHSKLVDAEIFIKKMQQKLTATEVELQNVNSKLSNVVSAYGQAGQNEIDSMKENLGRRLTSEYKKYLEIKSKGADIDYYEMLIFILDEVFKVLKKNGVTL